MMMDSGGWILQLRGWGVASRGGGGGGVCL